LEALDVKFFFGLFDFNKISNYFYIFSDEMAFLLFT